MRIKAFPNQRITSKKKSEKIEAILLRRILLLSAEQAISLCVP